MGRLIGRAVPTLTSVRERIDPSETLLHLAASQHEVLSLDQATRSGLGRHSIARLVREGRWQRLTPGLLFTGSRDPTWLGLAWGGILLGGEQARLSGSAAGYLHRIVADPPNPIEVLVPHGSRPGSHTWWTFRQEVDGVRGRSVQDPPRTSAEDTLLDLAAEATEGEVINLVLAAVQSRCVSVPALRRRLGARRRVRHRALIESLITEAAAGVHSGLELDYARSVERPHGLPTASRQHTNRASHQRDVRYDRFATVVELDGRLGHEGLGRFRDMHRDNFATVSGEASLRFGYWDVHERPCLIARQVGLVLARRGWLGELVACAKCRCVPLTDAFLP